MTKPALTIALPTFDRAAKLGRALARLSEQLAALGERAAQVEVLVSDNASSDLTAQVAAAARFPPAVRVVLHRQERNLGMDGNIRDCYARASGAHLWLLSDDDVLLPDAVSTVLSALASRDPDVLLFSFVQPAGAPGSFSSLPGPLEVTRPGEIIDYVNRCPKISIYVLRRRALRSPYTATLGTGFDFISIALDVVSEASTPLLLVLPQPLAQCDPDWNHIRFSPETWGNHWRVYEHPFVQRHAPDLMVEARRGSYYALIQFLWAWKVGAIVVEDDGAYARASRGLVLRWGLLARRPGTLVRAVAVKALPGTLVRRGRALLRVMRSTWRAVPGG